MTGLMRVLLCFVLPSLSAWGATIQATTQYDLSSSGGCCPSGFDQSTVQVTPAGTTAQAAVSRSNYARANAIAQFSSDGGIRLGAYSYARTSNSFDASIGGAATWAGVQAQASFFDNITVLSGPSGSLQWVFALHGTLTSSPIGCGVVSVWPYDLCSAHLRLYRQTQGAAAEAVATFSAVNGTRVIDQLVTINLPFTVGSGQSVGFGIYAATACDGLPLPPGRNCTSLSDFYNTATLVGFHVLDTQGNVVDNNVVLRSESEFDYFSVNVPEPSSFLLLLSGFAILPSRRVSRATRMKACNSEANAVRVPTPLGASSGNRCSASSIFGTVFVVYFGALSPYPAGASIVQFTLFPEDVSTQVVVNGYYLSLEIRGQFRAPTVDPSLYTLSSVTGTFSGDAGGATWGTGWPGEEMNASIGTVFAVGPRLPYPVYEGKGGTDGWSSLFSTAHVTSLSDFSVPSGSLPPDWLLAPGGPDDAGGYVPLPFHAAAWVSSALAGGPTSYPSKLAFVANLRLQLTYVLEPVAGSSALGTLGHASYFSAMQDLVNTPPVYSYVSYNSLDTQIPAVVLNQLPNYLTNSVPEPSTSILAGPALALLCACVLRRRCKRG